jgi:hypothetical protein
MSCLWVEILLAPVLKGSTADRTFLYFIIKGDERILLSNFLLYDARNIFPKHSE